MDQELGNELWVKKPGVCVGGVCLYVCKILFFYFYSGNQNKMFLRASSQFFGT